MLDGIDTLVVDLQDAGARFYTYPATMAYVMEEAARRHLAVVVLDRPNPIDGFDVEGPIAGRAVDRLQRLPADADPPRDDAWASLRELFNGEKQHRRGSHGRCDEELAARRLVR